jgi:protein phosphatase
MLKLKILAAHATDKGIKPRNEDFVGALLPDGSELTLKGAIAIIADGMSGSTFCKVSLCAEFTT